MRIPDQLKGLITRRLVGIIESAGEPVIGTASSERFGTSHASVHSAAASVVLLLSCIDAATLSPEFVRPWGRKAHRLRHPTHANFTSFYREGLFCREVRVFLSYEAQCIRGCDTLLRAEHALAGHWLFVSSTRVGLSDRSRLFSHRIPIILNETLQSQSTIQAGTQAWDGNGDAVGKCLCGPLLTLLATPSDGTTGHRSIWVPISTICSAGMP
jgi:hypothetical protein